MNIELNDRDQVDINDDYDFKCTCGKEKTQECADDI
jgi:hypothetical protein